MRRHRGRSRGPNSSSRCSVFWLYVGLSTLCHGLGSHTYADAAGTAVVKHFRSRLKVIDAELQSENLEVTWQVREARAHVVEAIQQLTRVHVRPKARYRKRRHSSTCRD